MGDFEYQMARDFQVQTILYIGLLIGGFSFSKQFESFMIRLSSYSYTYFCFVSQILVASPGAVNWTEATTDIPMNGIIGGNDMTDKRIATICRGMYDGRVIVGKTFESGASCWIAWQGMVYFF